MPNIIHKPINKDNSTFKTVKFPRSDVVLQYFPHLFLRCICHGKLVLHHCTHIVYIIICISVSICQWIHQFYII